ncbi:uncharacterized protein LOC109811256 isoform X2 [Cajanus cajan]|nr:uncharacterized protein LOC109811256 isoform X2 [Cajanus cajan]
MSIRTNPMKAVPSLLRRLRPVEKQENLKSLKSELIHLENLFSTVKKNEEELLDVLTAVDGYIRNSNIHKLMEEEESICQRIRDSTQKLLPPAATQSSNIKVAQSSEKATQSVKRKEVKIPQPEELERFK